MHKLPLAHLLMVFYLLFWLGEQRRSIAPTQVRQIISISRKILILRLHVTA